MCQVDKIGKNFERIVDLVGDSVRQLPRCSESFRSAQSIFGKLVVSNIRQNENSVCVLSVHRIDQHPHSSPGDCEFCGRQRCFLPNWITGSNQPIKQLCRVLVLLDLDFRLTDLSKGVVPSSQAAIRTNDGQTLLHCIEGGLPLIRSLARLRLCLSQPQQGAHSCHEDHWVDGIKEISIRSCLKGANPVVGGHEGRGYLQNRDGRRTWILFNSSAGFIARNIGQVDIEDDYVGEHERDFYRSVSSVGVHTIEAGTVKDTRQDIPILLTIIGNEDARPGLVRHPVACRPCSERARRIESSL